MLRHRLDRGVGEPRGRVSLDVNSRAVQGGAAWHKVALSYYLIHTEWLLCESPVKDKPGRNRKAESHAGPEFHSLIKPCFQNLLDCMQLYSRIFPHCN